MFMYATRDTPTGEDLGRMDLWLSPRDCYFGHKMWSAAGNGVPAAANIDPEEFPEEIRNKPGGKSGWPIKLRVRFGATTQ